jgi:surfeit locus 1 family protein
VIRLGAYRIRVKLVPALAAVLMLALLLWAGFWQLDRAEEKRLMQLAQAGRRAAAPVVLTPALLASATPEGLIYRAVEARGRYRSDRQYLLDNRTHNGVAGYHVLTPFILEESKLHVLINRGWLPVGTDRGRLPEVTVTESPLLEEGLIVAPPAAGLVLGSSGYDQEGWPKVVQKVDLQRIQTQIGVKLLPFMVRLSPRSEHGYVRDWHIRQGLSPDRHVGYAVQWFALATALVVLCIWVAVRRVPEDADAS